MDCLALSMVKQQVLESMTDMEGPCSPEELHERDTAARACMAEIAHRFDPMEEFIEQIEDPTSKRFDSSTFHKSINIDIKFYFQAIFCECQVSGAAGFFGMPSRVQGVSIRGYAGLGQRAGGDVLRRNGG